jgi:hypothetical protein
MKRKLRPSKKRANGWHRLSSKKSEGQALRSRPSKSGFRGNWNFRSKRTNWKRSVLLGWLKMKQTERQESKQTKPSANVA